MINGKLKKPIEQLTQADIDSKTTKSGTVSGEQLAALGGGVEVVKDWVRKPLLPSFNFFEGLSLDKLDGVIVEIRDLEVLSGSCEATLRMSRSGREFSTTESSLLIYTDANGGAATNRNNELKPWESRFPNINTSNPQRATFNVYEITVELSPTGRYGDMPLGNGNATMNGYRAESKVMSGQGYTAEKGLALSNMVYSTTVEDHRAEECSELWLDFLGVTAGEFSYRVIRK